MHGTNEGSFHGCRPDQEVVEVPLLLTQRQAAVLEAVAGERGLTAGQLLRHLLRDFLGRAAAPSPGQSDADGGPRPKGEVCAERVTAAGEGIACKAGP
jgi:hypothetical protein